MPRFLDKLAYRVADIVYYAQGCPEKLTPDGRVLRGGKVGRYLENRDAVRLARLLKRLKRTGTGCALLDFMQVQDIKIRFDHTMGSPAFGAGGGYWACDGTVVLNTRYSDDMLLGIMAHELRHAWQDTAQVPGDRDGVLPPIATIMLNRIREADAFAFEQKFLEDYAAVTGNSRPLRLLFQEQNFMDVPSCKDDAERFMLWYDRFVSGGVYDGRRMQQLEYVAAQRQTGKMPAPHISPDIADAIVLRAARMVDIVWPDTPQADAHYLLRVPDAALTGAPMKMMHPFLTDAFNRVTRQYAEDYKGGAATAKPSKKKPRL